MENFETFFPLFRKYHTHPITIWTHVISTAISTRYIFQYSSCDYQIFLFYGILLKILCTPNKLIYSSLFFLYICNEMLVQICFRTFIISLFVQYLSHLVVRESTMISSYISYTNYTYMYFSHLIFTVPSIVFIFFQTLLFPSNTIIYDKLTSDTETQSNMTILLQWIFNQVNINNQDQTHHWWYTDINRHLQEKFLDLNNMVMLKMKQNLKFSSIQPIHEMNEIYVSSNDQHKFTSDNVFYSKHIDGPFYLYPFCSVKRTILAINTNKNISTHFPNYNFNETLTTNEFVSFDFNRDIHYIKSNHLKPDIPRVTLKLHYIVYPKNMYFLGVFLKIITIFYDKHARNLFLYTLTPNTFMKYVSSAIVNYTTNLTYVVEDFIGFSNIFLLIICFAI